jgi:alanyl-tRNA synthetase
MFRIVSESSIAAGVRRIEALTADNAETYINKRLDLLEEIHQTLKQPKDLLKTVESLVNDNSKLQKEIEALQAQKTQELKDDLLHRIKQVNDTNVIAERVHVASAHVMKNLAFQLKQQVDNLYLVLAADIQGKPLITLMISENLVKQKNLDAGNIIKELAKEINGGGGGQPFYATAGGKNPDGIENVLKKSLSYI